MRVSGGCGARRRCKDIILKRPQPFAEPLRELEKAPDHAVLKLVKEGCRRDVQLSSHTGECL